jgi:hypothetical protein
MTDDDDFLAPPPEIAELAETCRVYVARALEVGLDYSLETLPVLDHYIAKARENVAERPELVELVTRSAGAYFGEVVRRAHPSFWRLPSGDAHDWQLCFHDVFLAFNPIAAVWDAIWESSEHAGPSSELVMDREDRDSLDTRLAALPPLSESEYWMLATRFEVIETAVDELRLAMQRAGVESVRFEPADYDVAPKPLGVG